MIVVICMVLHICDDVIFSIVIYEIYLWNYIFEYGKFFYWDVIFSLLLISSAIKVYVYKERNILGN